ncbi:hypothetical protein PSR33_04745 [Latilactobacillus curvatus]|uniref:Capsular polysaccharide biosynthesis protein n=1 Tax=Latilactobacillus curvatus TaxID=28038 RepID=A0AAJ5UPY5_LATCU|nr:hypothetical protein [Latilactobacillus curvatus]WDC91509.1 hypothetical protein PSR33_04745 [Latilactobacillus curvatus]
MNLSVHSHSVKGLLKGMLNSWRLFVATFVVLTLILEAGTYVYSRRGVATNTYSATSKVLLTQETLDGGSLQLYLNTEKVMIGSESFANYVSKQVTAKEKFSKSEVTNYQIENENGTSILNITATANSAQKAKQISNFVLEVVANASSEQLQGGNATVVETAETDETAKVLGGQSNRKLYVVAGLMAVILSFMVLFIRVYFDNRIYDFEIVKIAFPTAVFYEPADENEFKKNIARIFKGIKQNGNTVKTDITIFDGFSKIMGLLNVEGTTNVYSNQKLAIPEGMTQMSLDSLYEQHDANLNVIDATEKVAMGLSETQILVFNENDCTKKQVLKVLQELKQISNLKLVVIGLK